MRLNEDHQQRIQFLSTTLEEIATARVELRRQQEELDAREIAVRSERSTLQNLASTTSDLPAEVLAMIFEAGVRLANGSSHFGIPVSHVSRRWRNLALATPRLWTDVWCARSNGYGELSRMVLADRVRERAATFLSRTKSLSVDISIFQFHDEDFSGEFLMLIGEHMGHCRQLRINNANLPGLSKALEYLCTKPAPRLSSIDLNTDEDILGFNHALFPLGAPCLTSVQLDCMMLSDLHLCIPAFQSVTSMRLTGVSDDSNGDIYSFYREGLMAMKSLTHLELHFEGFMFRDLPPRLPTVLPKLQFLLADFVYNPSDIGAFIQALRAPSVRTLSLTAWRMAEQPEFSDIMDIKEHFPSLQHLILNGVSKTTPNLDSIARIFPGIERLTCRVVQPGRLSTEEPCGIEHIIAAVIPPTGTAEDSANNDAQTSRRWNSLKSIAMSAEEPLNAMALEDTLHKLKGVGHPLRELMLPKAVISQAGKEDMAHLKQLVDFKEFRVDWQTPFACRACGSRTRLLPPTCQENCPYSKFGGDLRPWELDP